MMHSDQVTLHMMTWTIVS